MSLPVLNAQTLLSRVFRRCAAQRRAAFIPFLVAGDPDFETSCKAINAAAQSGADIVEIGIPYSDPLADGPTIQQASHRARSAGTTFDRALTLARICALANPDTAFIAFSYYNPIVVRGIEQTVSDCAGAGLGGIIVPDLPFAESQALRTACARHGVALTFLVAPTTPLTRAAQIAAHCSDFVYVVSRMGITGASNPVAATLPQRLSQLRSITDKPLAVGFGVNSAAAAQAIARYADGVIAGSALIDRMEGASSGEEAIEEVRALCKRFAQACHRTGSQCAGG